jgi:hypothetical protein
VSCVLVGWTDSPVLAVDGFGRVLILVDNCGMRCFTIRPIELFSLGVFVNDRMVCGVYRAEWVLGIFFFLICSHKRGGRFKLVTSAL